MLLLRKSKDIDWLTIRNMCPCRGTCVPAVCCFSKLGTKTAKRVGLVQRARHHNLIPCNLFSP